MNLESHDGVLRARNTAFGFVPTFEPSRLRGFERAAVSTLDALNLRHGLKEKLNGPINGFNAWWIHGALAPVLHIDGGDEVIAMRAPRGIVLVSNHRSFFDMYVCSAWLMRHTQLARRLYFPVRSEYFYTNPTGVLLNLAISAGSMWPPVFRDEGRRDMNAVGLAQLAAVLGEGAMVGVHPEGRRNKGDDPYSLLPAKPGVGRLVLGCDPDVVVLPYFINGLTNAFGTELTRGRRAPEKRGEPVRITFGAPVTAGHLRRSGDDPVGVTADIMARIAALGERDRQARGR